MAKTNTNIVTLTGNLVRDSELRDAGSTKVLQFSIACNETIKKGDSWEEYANFFDCSIFGARANALFQYMKKGQSVVVSGKLHQDRWEKDGQKFSKIVVRADSIELTGGKSSSGNQSSSGGFKEDIPF